MAAKVGSSRTGRVVALVGASLEAPAFSTTPGIVRVGTGYEAAAELLAAPTAALVVDLGRVTSAHVRLLTLAARMEVPVLAFGTVSASIPAEVLGGVQLVALSHLGQAVARLLEAPAPGEAVRPVEVAQPAEAADAAPAPAQPGAVSAATPDGLAEKPAGDRPAPKVQRRRQPPRLPSEVLTPQEVQALLGEKR